MGKTLVTGAGGFIGSHLTEALVKQGHNVRAFLRYSSRSDRGLLEALSRDVIDRIEFVFGDLKDPEAVRKAVMGCDTVFHLGALIAIPYSYVHPYNFVQTNILGTAHVLNACLENPVLQKVIHTSTSEVYGTAQYVPIDEKHPLQAQSPYSATKIAADKLAESYYLTYGLPVAILRPFNTFGPRQSLRAVIPTIISQTLGKEKIKLGNVSPRRDFLFVKDTVRGFIEIAGSEKALGKSVNIGTGKDVSIAELIEIIFEVTGIRKEVDCEEKRIRPRTSEVMQLCSDIRLAGELFNWQPHWSLREGLKETVAWYVANLSKYRVGEYIV